jgi:glycolate oxidase iron-sulfur subunit
MRYLDSVLDEIENCAKCGSCRSVCPVFKEYGLEKKTARGKIAVCQAIADGALPFGENLHKILDDCLLCLTCVENCSRDVQTQKIIKAARAELYRVQAVKNRKTEFFSEKLPAGIPETSGLKYFFRQEADEIGRPGLSITDAPFIDGKDEVLEAENAVETICFFTGCFINHVYPDIGEAVVNVLNAVGVTVLIPKSQTCCGSPMAAAGDVEGAISLARENIESLSGNYPVITACASGGRMLKQDYPELLKDDDPWREKADALAVRTFDISEYLVEKIGANVIASKMKNKFTQTVTYHDPCQLNRGQKIKEAPRALLHATCGDNFMESPHPDGCCGAGTIYGITHPVTAEKIRSHKIEDIIRSGAQTVATGCPSCIKQLSDGLRQNESDIQIFHTIQIAAQAMGLPETPIDRMQNGKQG